jgi:CRISPR-associated protein Csh2
MSTYEVKNRSELVFIYDIKDTNPNGDPEENRPRIDEETEVNIVTDVRLKRTIRDYLANFKNEKIWLKEELEEDGTRKTREKKLEEEGVKERKDAEKLLEKYIDLRLFGALIAGKPEGKAKGEKVFRWTGPVQFKLGRSLHKVEDVLIRGTSVLPSTEMKTAGTFTETWILPYAMICFYGIINEEAAKLTKLTEEDINKLLNGMWNGTKNLITRSKIGQIPRLLIRVIYIEKYFHIGDLDKQIKLLDSEGKEIDKDGKSGKSLRSINDVKIDLTNLIEVLKINNNKIKKICIEADNEVTFRVNNQEVKGKKDLINAMKGIKELKDKIEDLQLAM